MASFLYEFDWDPGKAQTNFSKHGLDFERAATVILDPLSVTIPDEELDRNRGPVDYAGKGRGWPLRARGPRFRMVDR